MHTSRTSARACSGARGKLERHRSELGEFIRKNDHQLIKAGFGEERDAWLRSIAMMAGSRKKGYGINAKVTCP